MRFSASCQNGLGFCAAFGRRLTLVNHVTPLKIVLNLSFPMEPACFFLRCFLSHFRVPSPPSPFFNLFFSPFFFLFCVFFFLSSWSRSTTSRCIIEGHSVLLLPKMRSNNDKKNLKKIKDEEA